MSAASFLAISALALIAFSFSRRVAGALWVMTFVVDSAAGGEAAGAADHATAGGAQALFTAWAVAADLVAGGEEEPVLLVFAGFGVAVAAEGAIAEESGGPVEVASGVHQ
jgi:hypothetical protein